MLRSDHTLFVDILTTSKVPEARVNTDKCSCFGVF